MALSYYEYTADGTQVNYASKQYVDEAHLVVSLDGAVQASSTYTVSGTTLTFNNPPPTGTVIRIGRNSNQDYRLTNYEDASLLTADVMDDDANQLFYMAQEAIDTASETNVGVQKFYNASATAPVAPVIGDLWYDTYNKYLKIYNGTQWDLATPSNETYTFDNSSFVVEGTGLTIYHYINIANLTEDAFVFLNGVKQVRTTNKANVLASSGGDYFLDLADNKVYLAPLDAADVVEVTIAPADLGTNNNTQLETFTATEGQTLFDLTKSYVPATNTLHVYVNGVRQSAYTETLSTRVTFTNGLSAGDEVTFITNQYAMSQSFSASENVTYTPTGGTATTVSSHLKVVDAKLAETVSVKDFGAKGDGVTDDTAAIQAAIDSVPTGGKVVVPLGKYIVTDTITISQPIILEGVSAGFEEAWSDTDFIVKGSVIELKTGSFNSSSKPIIDITYAGSLNEQRVNAVIQDLVIHGNRGTKANPTDAAAKVNNTYGIGIRASGTRYLKLDNVYCLRCAEDGFKAVTGGTNNISTNNVQIEGGAFLGNGDDGIDWSGGDSFLTRTQCGYNGGDGIATSGGLSLNSPRCWDNFQNGLRIAGDDNDVNGGHYYDNERCGILISGSTNRNNVTGVVCQDNGKDTTETDQNRSGVRVSGATTNCTITGLNTSNKQESGTTNSDGTALAGQRYGLHIAATASVSYINIAGDNNGLSKITDLSSTSAGALGAISVGDSSTKARITDVLFGTVTFDPNNLNTGESQTVSVAITGASVGDTVSVALDSITSGSWQISGAVHPSGLVKVTITNHNASAVDLPSGNVNVLVFKAN